MPDFRNQSLILDLLLILQHDKTHDKTPLLDTTNTSMSEANITANSNNLLSVNSTMSSKKDAAAAGLSRTMSNRSSFRSRVAGTPGSLKKVMARAFLGRKKYSVKNAPAKTASSAAAANKSVLDK